jgi:preprotein translocase subunit SecA
MAGRGTDIMLGGNPEYLAKNKLVNLGYSHDLILQATSFAPSNDEAVKKAKEDYDHYYKLFKDETDKEKEKVIENGGLRIVGTERHESRRIDNQLRGRSGRQGDPGSTIFYISMEDDIARIFGGDRLYAIADRLNLDENVPIANKIITGQIEKAQRMIENRNYSVRKHVLSYDDVMNAQRDVIYAERKKVLENCDVHNEITNMIEFLAEDITDYFLTPKNDFTSWDFEACNNALNDRIFAEDTKILTEEVVQNNPYKTILQLI